MDTFLSCPQGQPAEMYATNRFRPLTLPWESSSTLNLLRVLTNLPRNRIWTPNLDFGVHINIWTHFCLVPNIQGQPAEMYATNRFRPLTLPWESSSTLNLLRAAEKSNMDTQS